MLSYNSVPRMEGFLPLIAEMWMFKTLYRKISKWMWPNSWPLFPTPGPDSGVKCFMKGTAMM